MKKEAEKIPEETCVLLERHAGKTYRTASEWIDVSPIREEYYIQVHYEGFDPENELHRRFLLVRVEADIRLQSSLGFERNENGVNAFGPWSETLEKLEFVKDRLEK